MTFFVFFVVLLVGVCDNQSLSSTEVCLSALKDTKKIFEVLPGLGWDNLENAEKYRVINISYEQCATTADRIFVIPDGIDVEPLKSSFIETFAETFDSVNSYSSATSASINRDFSATTPSFIGLHIGRKISGSFSAEAQYSKKERLERDSELFRVSVRYPRYRSTIKPDAQLHPGFRNRLQLIAGLLEENQTQMAKYETELLIKDFGTHVILDIEVGGILVKEDYITRTSWSERDKFKFSESIRRSSGWSFHSLFYNVSTQSNTGKNFAYNESEYKEYSKCLSNSKIDVLGGPMFKTANFSIEDWEDGLEANLIAIDRKGTPLYQFIDPYLLPEINVETVYKIENLATHAVMAYYKHNTIFGCTDPSYENFNSFANIDDGTCGVSVKTFLFGGAYQTCTEKSGNLCNTFQFVNPRTNDYSCPDSYASVLLWQGSKSYEAICREFDFSITGCRSFESQYEAIEYSIYWCSPFPGKPLEAPGLLFGGFWNPAYQSNPLTHGEYCPSGFFKMTLGLDLILCYADDIQDNRKNSITFGGFYSSLSGNPIAARFKDKNTPDVIVSFPKKCPLDFTKHLVTIDEDTEIYYCGIEIKSNLSLEIRNAIRPPFMRRPMIKQYDFQNAFARMAAMEAASVKTSILGDAEKKYSKMGKSYESADSLDQSSKRNSNTPNNQSNTTVVALSVVAGGLLMVMFLMAVVYIRKRKGNNSEESMRLVNQ